MRIYEGHWTVHFAFDLLPLHISAPKYVFAKMSQGGITFIAVRVHRWIKRLRRTCFHTCLENDGKGLECQNRYDGTYVHYPSFECQASKQKKNQKRWKLEKFRIQKLVEHVWKRIAVVFGGRQSICIPEKIYQPKMKVSIEAHCGSRGHRKRDWTESTMYRYIMDPLTEDVHRFVQDFIHSLD